MILDKMQIWSIFLFGFKKGPIAAKTNHNINNAFGPGTANKRSVQWFCKGDKSFEDEVTSEGDMNN